MLESLTDARFFELLDAHAARRFVPLVAELCAWQADDGRLVQAIRSTL